MGDYNAKHATWCDMRGNESGQVTAKDNVLHRWATQNQAAERGPRGYTRHAANNLPSKIDLIWTKRDDTLYGIYDYGIIANSDHLCLSIDLTIDKPP